MASKFASALVWFVMAAMSGLFGFFIIYHYANFERPLQHFAIVIDAGSTQTRSSLYTISIDSPELAKWTNEVATGELDQEGLPKTALSKILQVRQVSNCVNGGPLADIQSHQEARELVRRCLIKFVDYIKRLDFVESSTSADFEVDFNGTAGDALESEEVSRQLALMNRRVNSVSHLYMGATAGMRALERLNRTRAGEKLHWMEQAIGESNMLLHPGDPFINKGFVGIIGGAEEATFGWLSVNFICENLFAQPEAGLLDELDSTGELVPDLPEAHVVYSVGVDLFNSTDGGPHQHHTSPPEPQLDPSRAATLELGGASAQMAYQVASQRLGSEEIEKAGLGEQNIEIFNGKYKLATRSDLCLGMSQAVIRSNYVLLRQFYASNEQLVRSEAHIQLKSPCQQRASRFNLTGMELSMLWHGSCLAGSQSDGLSNEFRSQMVADKRLVTFVGSGDVEQCGQLLSMLLEPEQCSRYFSLCPASKNKLPPPTGMPFVTISGYNHALNALNLAPQRPARDSEATDLERAIEDKLGGQSVDYLELVNKTREFCAVSLADVGQLYPKVAKEYRSITCLQLVYINKLLTEFYLFEPATSWRQIKFLLFKPNSDGSTALAPVAGKKLDIRRDIGWTLGLLLNATSQRLMGHEGGEQIFFHHGASVLFAMRATLLLMLACCLLAVGLLIIGVLEVRRARRRGTSYISHTTTYEATGSVNQQPVA